MSFQRDLKDWNRSVVVHQFSSHVTPPLRSWTVQFENQHLEMCVLEGVWWARRWSRGVHKFPNKTSKNLSTGLSAALCTGDKASVIILTATGVSVVSSGLLALCLLFVWMKARERDTRWMAKGEREGVWWVLAHGPAHGTSSVFVCVLFVSESFMPLPGRQGCCWNRITHAAQGESEGGGEERRGEEEKQERPRENHREKLDCGKPRTLSFHLHNLLSPPCPSPPYI